MSLPTYLTLPLLNWMPDWAGPTTGLHFNQAKFRLDRSAGPIKDETPYQPRPRTSMRVRYIFEDREGMTAARDFLRTVAYGRLKTFWVPMWSQAVQLVTPMDDTDTTLITTASNYTKLYGGVGYGREHLGFVPAGDNGLIVRKVTDAVQDEDTGQETLTLSSAVGFDITLKDPVCFVLLCRLDTDVPVLTWLTPTLGVLEIPVIDLPVQTP